MVDAERNESEPAPRGYWDPLPVAVPASMPMSVPASAPGSAPDAVIRASNRIGLVLMAIIFGAFAGLPIVLSVLPPHGNPRGLILFVPMILFWVGGLVRAMGLRVVLSGDTIRWVGMVSSQTATRAQVAGFDVVRTPMSFGPNASNTIMIRFPDGSRSRLPFFSGPRGGVSRARLAEIYSQLEAWRVGTQSWQRPG